MERSSDDATRNKSSATRSVTFTDSVSVRLPSSAATTYADLVEPLTRQLLEPLRAARGEYAPEAFAAAVFRPLGGALLARLARDPALDLERVDPLSVAVAHTMLDGWLRACVADTTPLPMECHALPADEAARRALCAFLAQHWPALR